MTYSIKLTNRYKIVFSDSAYKPYRKKPTVSIYDTEKNIDTKIASFNNQEAFEWLFDTISEGRKEQTRWR